jgi:hypothetical protein
MPALQDHFITVASRTGYAAKGMIYVLLGGLAAGSAFTSLDEEGSSGLLDRLAESLPGRILLIPLTFGLVTYIVWRMLQFFFDTEDKGNDAGGWALRTRYLASGIAYTSVANAAAHAVWLGYTGSDGDESAQSWSALTLGLPGGRLLLAGFALGVFGFALQQARRAWKLDFSKHFSSERLHGKLRNFVLRSSRLGFYTRSIIFLTIGTYLFISAWQSDPDEVKGLGGALRVLHEQPFGPWILCATGIGLIAYGVYALARSGYGKVGKVSDEGSSPSAARKS